MHPPWAWNLPLGLVLMACTSEGSAPTAFEATPSAVRSAGEERFGISGAPELGRGAVLEGRECNMGPAGSTFDSRITYSAGGSATLRCRTRTGDGPTRALLVRDELCAIPAPDGEVLFTFAMHFVWSPSGAATLVCHRTRR